MGLCISHGIGIPFQKSSQSWSSYWLTRYILDLIIETLSGSSQKITAVIVGTGYDGVSFEYSADNMQTWVDAGVSATGVLNATDLTDNTFYYWRARLYKGSNFSDYSYIYFSYTNNWYLEGGITPANAQLAAKPIGKSTLAESYVNEANGANAITPVVAPVLSETNGWVCDGTQDLATTLIPLNNQTWSMVVKYSGYVNGDINLFGVYEGATKQFYIGLNKTNNRIYWANGGVKDNVNTLAYAVLGFAGNKAYKNGVIAGETAIPSGSGSFTLPLHLLTCNASPVTLGKFIGNVQAIAVYNTAISASQIIAVSIRLLHLNSIEQDRYQYMKMGFGAFVDWSMATFYYTDTVIPDIDVNTFNPTDYNIDEMLDTFVSAGMKYVVWNIKSEVGFCLYPTEYHVDGYLPYAIQSTNWYANNNNIDITQDLVNKCKERGLKVIFYFSVYDANFEARKPDWSYADYVDMIDFQVAEILNRYSGITAMWFDDWAWRIAYTDIPFDPVYNLVKSIQPKCLVLSNEQIHPSTHGDIDIHENTVNTPSASNMTYSEWVQAIRLDEWWLYRPTDDPTQIKTKATILANMATANSRWATYSLGVMMDRRGRLETNQKALLDTF